MEVNKILRDQFIEIINNQIKKNDPPETKLTFQRLTGQGFSEFEAKQFIGRCLAIEIFETLKFNKPFKGIRYIRNLSNLPKEPEQ